MLPDFSTDSAVQVTVFDLESEDQSLTVRPQLFMPTRRMVVCITAGDEESEPLAVALDRADVERVRDAMSAWLDAGESPTRAQVAALVAAAVEPCGYPGPCDYAARTALDAGYGHDAWHEHDHSQCVATGAGPAVAR